MTYLFGLNVLVLLARWLLPLAVGPGPLSGHEYDSQYTDNIKFPYSDDLCLSGSNNDKHKVFAEPCGEKHQHWSF